MLLSRVLLFFLAGIFLPASLCAQDPPYDRWRGYILADNEGVHHLWVLYNVNGRTWNACYLEDTLTKAVIKLPVENLYRYDLCKGYLIGYGPLGQSLVTLKGTVICSGYRSVNPLRGDTLFIASEKNGGDQWAFYHVSGTLLASGIKRGGSSHHDILFVQLDDSTMAVPGPDKKWALMSRNGTWLTLPAFDFILRGENGLYKAGLYSHTGMLSRSGTFTCTDDNWKEAVVIPGPFFGMGEPYCFRVVKPGGYVDTCWTPGSGEAREKPWLTVDRYDSLDLLASRDHTACLVDHATGDTILLPISEKVPVHYAFLPPFVRASCIKDGRRFTWLFDFNGAAVIRDAYDIEVVAGDSTIMVHSPQWEIRDWNGNTLARSQQPSRGTPGPMRYVGSGRYTASARLDSLNFSSTLYYLTDKHGRCITDPVFITVGSFSPQTGRAAGYLCDGRLMEIDTAGDIYFNGDSLPHRITRESLMQDKNYRKIVVKRHRRYSTISVKINPYCYDTHTERVEGKWNVTCYYRDGKLVLKKKRLTRRIERRGKCILLTKQKVRYRNGLAWKSKSIRKKRSCYRFP